MIEHHKTTEPVAANLEDFDQKSGSLIERQLFTNRLVIVALCLIVTAFLGFEASRIELNASFEQTLPADHPFIVNYMDNQTDLKGLGNAIRIAVESTTGSIYDKRYQETLRKISDAVFLLPGVDRAFMKSLWTPNTRWIGVTEEGLEGGPVIPDGYDGGPESLEALRTNVSRSGEIGQLVAVDGKSSVITVPLLSTIGAAGKPLDYGLFSQQLEQIRVRYTSDAIKIHITGFAKIIGDLIDGLRVVLLFFLASVVIAGAFLYGYTRCVRSTALVVTCSLVAVAWQIGLLPMLGLKLDPYSILVPFLVFAIGMSHGAQKMNGIMQDIGRGQHRVVAARHTFRRLFVAGFTALVCDAVGFAALLVIRIPVIQELAITASVGVAVLIFTNLILLPILLSYIGVSPEAAMRSLQEETAAKAGRKAPLWNFLDLFTRKPLAPVAVGLAIALGTLGYLVSLKLTVGDLDPGAPELRADSVYNRDTAFMTAHYAASSDVFVVMVKTADGECAAYDTLMRVDALEARLQQLDGVDSTKSLARLIRQMMIGLNEGGLKWYDLPHSQQALNSITTGAPRGLYSDSCGLLTVYAYLKDHKAETLQRVVDTVETFAAENDTADTKYLLAAGSAGIEAATNIVVRDADRKMLLIVYAAVVALSFVTFRSWRAVLVAVLPLALTSVLAEALMVVLGMGVKVATLPVMALGVGIGIDYALYVLSVVMTCIRQGEDLSTAYYRALQFTGKVVMLTGLTLAVGVGMWAFSPIKFQADMGVLLAFMFLWNMVGALLFLPALAYYAFPQSRGSATTTEHAVAVLKELFGSEVWAPRLLSVLRIAAALLFMEHGTAKFFAFPHVAFLDHVPLLSPFGFSGVLEAGGGALLLLGACTRPVAFLLSGDMAVGYFMVHAPKDFFPILNMGEAAVLYCFVFLFLAVAGGGAWSLDALIARRRRASRRGAEA